MIVPQTILNQFRKLEPGKFIELFLADLSPVNQTNLFFHNYQVDSAGVGRGAGPGQIAFGGQMYSQYPIVATGFEMSTTNVLPRPHLRVTNFQSAIAALMLPNDDLHRCKVIRLRTLDQYLDGGAWENGQAYLSPDVYYVDRRVAESKLEVEVELGSLADVTGLMLPTRIIQAGYCGWLRYRGVECSYTGPPVTDERGLAIGAVTDRGAWSADNVYALGDYAYVVIDNARDYYVSKVNGNTALLSDTTKWVIDTCLRSVPACKAHQYIGGVTPVPLTFGGFPGTATLPRTA